MQFHLGDVLSITHDRLLSPSHVNGVYKILNYMTGDDLFTHQLPRAGRICKPELLRQHPQLDTIEVDFQIARLGEMLESESGKSDPANLVAGWLFNMTLEYGEMLDVQPLRPSDYEQVDAMEELESMVGKDRIIVVKDGKASR